MKPSERELPLIQRGIIDTCFEEGQYEYGIDVLDKLRTQGYKPLPLHIRQLLYISLYPPPPPPSKCVGRPDVSPQKNQFPHQKQDLWPKPGSRPLAIALLNAFIRTNTPECLMRSLPHYSYIDRDGLRDVDPFGQEKPLEEPEDNSPLKDELLGMQSLKDCWGLLRDGFVKRKQVDRSHVDKDESIEAESTGTESTIVGPYAWPVLEWLIQAFEKDERREREEGHEPYSALLLCQIPPPRDKTGPRWDADIPLQVVFACFSPISHTNHYASVSRCDLGSRLISLLVNLTLAKPTLLSPTVFLSSLTTRLFDLPVSALQAFFSAIPTTQIMFKISVLYHYILTGDSMEGKRTRKPGASVSRAKPKFTGRGTSVDISSKTELTGTQDIYKDPYPMPSRDNILSLLSSPLRGPRKSGSRQSSLPLPSVKIALAKFYLVSALCSLHLSHQLEDAEWNVVVREGKLRQGVLNGFAIGGKIPIGPDAIADNEAGEESGTDERNIRNYMRSVLEMVNVWEVSSEK